MTTRTKRDPSETSVLSGIYHTLKQQSAHRHAPVGRDLRSGARLTVSVRGETVTVIIARPDKPLGGTEISTFMAHCQIPPTAERAPADGSQQVIEIEDVTWHRVAWRFTERKTQ